MFSFDVEGDYGQKRGEGDQQQHVVHGNDEGDLRRVCGGVDVTANI
jgi:hypothetical protein